MKIPIDKNRKWVANLHESIDSLSKEQKSSIMKQAGSNCADDLFRRCESLLGRQINSIKDLIRGWNILRNSRNLKGKWAFEDNLVHGIFYECGCPLVRSGMIELHSIQCLCSKGMMEIIFSKVAKRSVKVELKQAIGRGDCACELLVTI